MLTMCEIMLFILVFGLLVVGASELTQPLESKEVITIERTSNGY